MCNALETGGMADKPYRAPLKRGPVPTLNWVKKLTVKVGERELAMIRLYARRYMGMGKGGTPDVSAILRRGLEMLCREFTPDEIDTEIATDRPAPTE